MWTHRLLTLVAVAATASAQEAAGPQDQDLVARLEARLARSVGVCVGVEGLVALADEPLVHVALGLRPDGRPREPGDLLRAPALGRVLTSLAVLRLASGEPRADLVPLDLDASVATYLPALRMEGEPVTVRQVLAGTSGYTPYDGVLTREQRAEHDVARLLEVVAAHGLVASPGHCFEPSESEALVLGALVEAVTGAPLARAWRELFEVAGLERTGVVDEADAPPRVAGPTTVELDLDRLRASSLAPFGEDRLCTTVSDLARLSAAVAAREVLGERALADLVAPQRLHGGHGTGFGLGVDLVQLGDLRGVTFGGGGVGGALHVVRFPEAGLLVVLAATAPDAPLAELARDLARTALGLPAPGVQDLPLEAQHAARLVGGYQLGCNRLVVALGDGGRLTLSAVDRPTRTLLHQGESRFVAQDCDDCRFEFLFREGGERASAMVLMEHGQRTEAIRID